MSHQQQTGKCPNCGSEDIVKVWEYVELYQIGLAPKFVGCEDCGEMIST